MAIAVVSSSDEDSGMESVLDPLFDPFAISEKDITMIGSLLDDNPPQIAEELPNQNEMPIGNALSTVLGNPTFESSNSFGQEQVLDPISLLDAGFEWPSLDLSMGCETLSKSRMEDTCVDMMVSPMGSDQGSGRNISIEYLLSDAVEQTNLSIEQPNTQGNGAVNVCEIASSLECQGNQFAPFAKIGESLLGAIDTSPMPINGTETGKEPDNSAIPENVRHISNLPQLPSARQRYSDGARPSKYCHVCGRCSSSVGMLACFFSQKNLCRKVVCHICVKKYDNEFTSSAQQTGQPWSCTHCRGMCPKRARCVQYYRNNQKRRMRNLARKIGKESSAISTVGLATGDGTMPHQSGVLEKIEAINDSFSPTGIPDGVFQTT